MLPRCCLAPVTALLAAFVAIISGAPAAAAERRDGEVRRAVDDAVKPVIAEYKIPGMAVGVTIGGTRHVFTYGLAATNPRIPVTRDTLFELGSVSKTFTATLAAYAEAQGKLSLDDTIGKAMPALDGSALGKVRLLHLATHTAGGFPLQLPGDVKTREQLIAYFRAWTPHDATGTRRTYANPSIGLLGMIAARSLGGEFQSTATGLFRDLGLRRTFVGVPAAEMASYAWGYRRDGRPVRVAPALLGQEAYGVTSTVPDMLRFLEVNMGIGSVQPGIARAVAATHRGHFRAGGMVQDLIWEQYPYPVDLDTMVEGNSARMSMNAVPVTALEPPMPPRENAILNKTGSTNGFGAYVAFIPGKTIGIVMLANRAYANEARVKAAYRILSRLTR